MKDIKKISALILLTATAWLVLVNLQGTAQEEDTTQADSQESVGVPKTGDEDVEDIGLQAGDEAPKFALRVLDGGYELLTKWSGKTLTRPASQPVRHVVVVSFFATWCGPCMKELPHLQNLYEKYQGQDIKFFLIDITEATRMNEGYENSPEAGPFLKNKGITIPILQDVYGMAKKNYGVTTLPRLFVIDKFRTIRLTKRGFHAGEDFEGELAAMIDTLLAEELEEE